MKAPYVVSGIAGGVVAVGLVSYRIYERFHRIADLNSRDDVQTNVLVVLGIGAGIIAIPIGVALGVLAAAVISRVFDLLRRSRFTRRWSHQEEPSPQGASWVTQRNRPNQDDG
ncbi:MAG: hypothetical protein ACE5Q6_25270 [Dehalococcoidia bacterium]